MTSLVRAHALAPADAAVTDVIELRFDQRERSRLRAAMASGEEIGIDLPVGVMLAHGSRLALTDGRVVAVEAALETVLQVTAPEGAREAGALLRIAYHVGNRHVPIEIGEHWLRILPDHVLRAMIERLGGQVVEARERFHPEAGAYGHGHVHGHHAHDHEGHGGRIHSMTAPGAG